MVSPPLEGEPQACSDGRKLLGAAKGDLQWFRSFGSLLGSCLLHWAKTSDKGDRDSSS